MSQFLIRYLFLAPLFGFLMGFFHVIVVRHLASPVDQGAGPPKQNSASVRDAQIFTKWDPRFRDALEPGIRELVLALIDVLDCITYSSCEGHLQSNGDLPMSVRHVGILPRDDEEYSRFLRILEPIVYATNSSRRFGFVRVVLSVGTVTSEGTERPCIDFIFAPEANHEKMYFQEVEPVYLACLKVLKAAKSVQLPG